ncbi:hypothetical protein IVB27_41485 [Bradyrhizobium sp. 197]|uniref:hypothetical protein n=1 Tax=Bradyrhizobium sp. 197 TaxID=2782663 RepID=UPI001FF934F3|nr:hypothetical protein [Bradyrhizobium sp. 197]MCK1481029.1 hypothetical protein [Bradyrhizobium sp. 197]
MPISPVNPDTSLAKDPGDDDTDGCLCGMDHLDEDATLDEELPAGIGGIETDAEKWSDNDEDDVDGREIGLASDDQTTDEELPIAFGGT